MDIVQAMEKDAGTSLSILKVDGGASRNNLLMQFQADIIGRDVERPLITETTALGAACLAGLAVGIWSDLDELKRSRQIERTFTAQHSQKIELARKGWADAVRRALSR